MVGTIGASKPKTGIGVLTLEQITASDQISALDSLTERELEVLGLIANGASNPTIAGRLGIELKTVERHINHLYSELGINEDNTYNPRVKAVLMYRERYPFEFIRQQVEVNLTPREYEVLSYIAKGYSNLRISKGLHIEPKTIERHINSIYSKLLFYEGVDKRVVAALMYDKVPKPS